MDTEVELGNFDDFSRKASTHLHALERIGFQKPIPSLRDFQYKGGKVLFSFISIFGWFYHEGKNLKKKSFLLWS